MRFSSVSVVLPECSSPRTEKLNVPKVSLSFHTQIAQMLRELAKRSTAMVLDISFYVWSSQRKVLEPMPV